MYLYVTVLLVAMATSHVDARLYDLPDCSVNHVARNTHHADDPNDCRYFYNCDNNNGGVKTTCPSGTLYDSESGLCTQNATCNSWIDSVCSRHRADTVTEAAECCSRFYTIDCKNKDWSFSECPTNQNYDAEAERCTSGPRRGNCTVCSPVMPTNKCDATHQEYIGDKCQYRVGLPGSYVIMRCAQGTVMDRDQCRCVKGKASDCAPSRECAPENAWHLDFARKAFVNDGTSSSSVQLVNLDANSITTEIGLNSTAYVRIPFFAGQDLYSNPSAFLLKFRLNNVGGEHVIMDTATDALSCVEGVTMKVVANVNDGRFSSPTASVTVTLTTPTGSRVNGEMTFPGTFSASQEITVRILIKDGTVSGKVSGRSTDSSVKQIPRFVGKDYKQLSCPLDIGRFSGALTELRYWQCADAGQMVSI